MLLPAPFRGRESRSNGYLEAADQVTLLVTLWVSFEAVRQNP